MRNRIAALLFLLLATSAQAQSQPPFGPPGLPARANDVAAQFQAMEARLARLEGGALNHAAIAGTYRIFGLQTGLFAPYSGTYAVSQNTKVTLANFGGPAGIDFYGAAGGRILVATFAGEDPPPGQVAPMGTDVLLILVRTN
jgi:hypothetical protein